MKLDVNVTFDDPVLLLLLRQLLALGGKLVVTQQDIANEIKAAKTEFAAAIKDLSDKLAAAIASQDLSVVQAAADDLKAYADSLAAPVPPTPAP